MSKNTSSSSSGIGFVGLLAVAFIVLKLCGVIAWPWRWVLLPIWVPTIFWLSALLTLIVIVAVKKKK
jgi:hypothetical protein